MRVVVAPQALKGSLSAVEAAQAIARGVNDVFPEAEVQVIPIADGGEGTVHALVAARGGKIVEQTVKGPRGEPVEAFYGLPEDGQGKNGGNGDNRDKRENEKMAVIEMAACAGLPLVPAEKRDPRVTTTYGVGELIRAALDRGCRHFIVGIGGSATNDGGAGMAQALGAELLTSNGEVLGPGGAALMRLASIRVEGMDPRLASCTFEVACDVRNPLCGPTGATAVYGPQKGATPEMVQELDAALLHYAHIIERDLHKTVHEVPGAGAAGGMGAGLIAFLGATLRPGAEIVLEAVGMEDMLQTADLLITAEGKLDAQTGYGKSVAAVTRLAQRHGVPVVVVTGGLEENYQWLYGMGVAGIAVLPSRPMSLVYSIEHAARLIHEATERALRLIKLGRMLK